MITISITNQKGGVGKTTTAISLACSLADRGNKVLLVDMDPQGNSTSGVGVHRGEIALTTGDVLLRSAALGEAVIKTEIERLSVLPAHIGMTRMEKFLDQASFRETLLRRALDGAQGEYDYCICDCSPSLGTFSINAIYAADFFLIPCEIGRYALDGFADLIDTIMEIKGDNFPFRQRARILQTKYDTRGKIGIAWAEKELKTFEDIVLKAQVRRNEAIIQSQMASLPIRRYSPKSMGAQDYEQVVEELLDVLTTTSCRGNKT